MKMFFVIPCCFLLNISFCILAENCYCQPNKPSISSVNRTSIKLLDIVKDFKADPTGKKSSQLAFEAAATFINARHGFADLLIPEGIFLVGKQVRNGKDKNNIIGFMGADVFKLDSCNQVTIHGMSNEKTRIKVIDGMKFGSFDSVGNRPTGPEEYNWYPHRLEKEFTMTKYTQHLAYIGQIFKISNCTNIILRNLNINGNANKYELGGNWSDKGRQADADAIMIFRSAKLTFANLNISEMGRDGILILDPNTIDTTNLKTQDISFKNINIKYSGRNGISWCGGENIEFTNCNISFTGKGIINSPPMAGIDIEPEASICKNGRFTNCVFINNLNMGLASDRGESIVKDSYNMSFSNCRFVQSSTDGYVVFLRGFANAYVFDKCEFYGLTLNGVIAQSENESTKYQHCLFQDCYNGARVWTDINSYLLLSTGTRTIIDNCTFNSYQIASFAIRGENGKKCDEIDEFSKTLIKNSTFNSYMTLCSGNNCPQNGSGYAWVTRFLNNKFNYVSSKYLIDVRPGCSGAGNTDEGNGFIMNQRASALKMPACQN